MYSIPKETLKKVLSGFRTLRLAKTSLPVLRSLKFEVRQGSLRITGTNLDDALACHLHSVNPVAGAHPVLVPVDLLKDAVKAADSKTPVVIEPGNLTVTAGATPLTRSFEEIPLSEFPYTGDNTPPDRELELSANLVACLLEAKVYASEDPTRFVLNGIHLTQSTIVGTNGRRLCIKTLRGGDRLELPKEKGVILPTRAPLGLFKPERNARLEVFLPPKAKNAEAEFRHFSLSQGAWSWRSKLVDGKYPEWRQVVPKDETYGTRLEIAEEDAGKLAGLLTKLPGNGDKDAPVDLVLENREAFLSAYDGKTRNTVPLDKSTIDGSSTRVRFNRTFLHDALKQGFRRMRVKDELSAVLMEDDNKNRLTLWMPLRMPHPERTPAESKPDTPAHSTPSSPQESTGNGNGAGSPSPATIKERNQNGMATQSSNPRQPTVKRTNGSSPSVSADPLERLQQAVGDLKNLTRDLGDAVQEVNAAMKETSRERKALGKEYRTIREKIKSLKALEL